jgi:predicted PurR-regulated permease PerM
VLILFGFRVQDAFFVGVIEGVFNIIPYVGPWVGFVLSALAGLSFSTTATMGLGYVMLVLAGTILLAQAVDNYFISPRVFSQQVNAHPLEVFIVILLAGSVGGIVGMLLAIPSYTVLRVFAKEFFSQYTLVKKLTKDI